MIVVLELYGGSYFATGFASYRERGRSTAASAGGSQLCVLFGEPWFMHVLLLGATRPCDTQNVSVTSQSRWTLRGSDSSLTPWLWLISKALRTEHCMAILNEPDLPRWALLAWITCWGSERSKGTHNNYERISETNVTNHAYSFTNNIFLQFIIHIIISYLLFKNDVIHLANAQLKNFSQWKPNVPQYMIWLRAFARTTKYSWQHEQFRKKKRTCMNILVENI